MPGLQLRSARVACDGLPDSHVALPSAPTGSSAGIVDAASRAVVFRATRRVWHWGGGDAGTAPAEFAMIAGLLTFLTLAIMQLALVLHVRNTVQDAAAEGARVSALVGNRPADGITRTKDLIGAALGGAYARDVRYSEGRYLDHPAAVVTVTSPLPVLGLFGPHRGLEVQGHAAVERTPLDP